VDVMVFLRKGEGIAQTGVYPIIKNVRVFSKGAETERVVDAKSGQATRARTISLLVKLTQAQEIALASQMGKISLALRNPKDDPTDDKDETVPLSELLNGKATSGDDKKPVAASDQGNLLSELKKAASPSTPAPPKEIGFVMTVQSPNEIKSYQWSDLKALPTESVLLSMGASSAAAPTTPDSASPAPPVKVDGDSKRPSE